MFVQVHVVVPERYKKFSLFINTCCPQPVKSIAFCIIIIVFNSAGPNCERVFYRLKPLKAKQGESRTGKTMEFSCSVIMYSC